LDENWTADSNGTYSETLSFYDKATGSNDNTNDFWFNPFVVIKVADNDLATEVF